jgi:hypothetical protein
MFHTPPVKSDWKTEIAINNSYDLANTDSNSNYSDIESQPATLDTNEAKEILSKTNTETSNIDEVKSSAIEFHDNFENLDKHIESSRTYDNNTTLNSDSSSFIESSEVPSESDLPIKLLKVYESFLKELKEPKFERSLASFEIAELFHGFYRKFYVETKEYIETEGKFELHEKNFDVSYQYYKYNLILERLLCDKFYSQIIFPLKSIEIDDYEKDFNDEFSDKLGCLSSLDIHFRHLDIDLPEELELEFIKQLEDKILPEFELLTAERSPTLKMKYLIRIHKKIGLIINELTKTTIDKSNILNTDIYLPILIFTIIKLKELRAYFLVRQLNLIKRFSNEYIFENSTESFQLEKGKLLYVCANFEAAISYLSSVTLDNFEISLPSEDINLLPGSLKRRDELLKLLTVPLKLESIDEHILNFRKTNPLLLSSDISLNKPNINSPLNNFTNSWLDYSKVSLPNSVINADQGIKSISQTIDSSLKSIMGKVSWISGSNEEISTYYDETLNEDSQNNNNQHDNTSLNVDQNTLSDTLLKQLEENDAFLQLVKPQNEVTPVSSAFNDSHAAFGARKRGSSDVQEGLLSKFTISVGGVMKNFRPLSESSSTTSLTSPLNDNSHTVPTNISATGNNTVINDLERSVSTGYITSPNKNNSRTAINMRSRATSFMNTSLFGSPNTNNNINNNEHLTSSSPSKEYRSSIFSSLESAFDNVRNRSRDNSLSQNVNANIYTVHSSTNSLSNINVGSNKNLNVSVCNVSEQERFVDDLAQMKPITKAFEELSIIELREMYNQYQRVLTLAANNRSKSRNSNKA